MATKFISVHTLDFTNGAEYLSILTSVLPFVPLVAVLVKEHQFTERALLAILIHVEPVTLFHQNSPSADVYMLNKMSIQSLVILELLLLLIVLIFYPKLRLLSLTLDKSDV